jgi:hypothetical protein
MTRDEQEAIRKLCEHFLIMCPTMRNVAVNESGLWARYYGYVAPQDREPPLPEVDK